MSRVRLISIALLVLTASAAVGAVIAQGHYRTGRGTHFFAGHTQGDKPRPDQDPINMILNGGDRTVDDVEMIENWNGNVTSDHEMQKRGSFFTADCLSGQNLQFRMPSDFDDEDRQYTTKKCAHDRWHARVWDSVEHDDYWEQRDNHPRDRFAVLSIHKDNYQGPPFGGDKIRSSWELAEKIMVKEIGDKYCSWQDVRTLPGSAGKFQRQYSNGEYSRISPEEINEEGPCRVGNG